MTGLRAAEFIRLSESREWERSSPGRLRARVFYIDPDQIPMRSRSTFRVLLLAALAAVSGCGEDGTDPLLPASEGIRATWAGESFRGEAVVYKDGPRLELIGYTEDGQLRSRGLRVRISDYAGPGSYALNADAAQVMYVVGGDQISARYGTTAAGAGTLVVTAEADGRLVGHAAFDADALPSASQPAGSRARFEGMFNAPVQTPGW
jgi:hypothetical protein